MLTRRRLIQSGLTTAAAASFGPAFWRSAFAQQPSRATTVGPYGWLRAPDANGLRLPPRFTSRVVAKSRTSVAGTGYVFPDYPDGAATYRKGAGWILAVNSEVSADPAQNRYGGASGIEFDRNGNVVSAYRILDQTSTNCAGGWTPWGAWLSCEETARGQVWECDVTGATPAVPHPAMGRFQHEAACVDAANGHIYLSEDVNGGGLYRFTPFIYPVLSAGTLEIACPGIGANKVTWKAVPDPSATIGGPTRGQVPEARKFARGEGIWFDSGHVYLATTTDETIHVYDTVNSTIEILYKADLVPDTPLRGIDNLLVTKSGDLMVAEDSYSNDPDAMDVCLITRDNQISRFCKITGTGHFAPAQSEVVSIAFNPDGDRLYVGSQRFDTWGVLYEISGPFRSDQATVFQDIPEPTATPIATATPVPIAATPTPQPPAPKPGPIGLEVTRRIAERSFIRSGLAIGLTLDGAASIRVRVTAKIGNRTKTLATLTKRVQPGRSMLRVKASKSGAKLLKGRRRDVQATVEIRITAPGKPAQTIKRTVTVRQ